MTSSPPNIYDEPPVSPDTLSHLGPLKRLAGEWRSDTGLDISPKEAGPEHTVFLEHATFEPIDGQTNGPQLFYGLRYHLHINKSDEEIAFHDQVGYWLWEPATGLLLQSVTIPRGEALLAQGHAVEGDNVLSVEAVRGSTVNGISANPFLEQNFRSDRYRCVFTLHDDETLSYDIITTMTVKGYDAPFDHHDSNTLRRVAGPKPNPYAILAKEKP